MLSYYLFMALLVTTLVLWAILALKEETPKDQAPDDANGANDDE